MRLAEFVEQPHVLDRNHRLVGERGEQLDLASVNGRMERHASISTPIGVSFSQKKHAEDGVVSANVWCSIIRCVLSNRIASA